MKLKILVLVCMAYAHNTSAQLTINPGAQFSITGNEKLTLQNTGLINNGSFSSGNSIVAFSGASSSFINGSQPVQFNELEINKTGNSSVILQKSIVVTQRIFFNSGFLDLNGFNTDLGTTGHLDGEQENTRIKGANGGEVLFNVNLNAPTGSNPANLGIFITSGKDLGNVTIKRGHQSQFNTGAGNTVFRYYEILPANNTNLDAILRFRYLDTELNGLNETSLVFLQTQNAAWTNIGFTSRDAIGNFVERNNISSFTRFTLSVPAIALAVNFLEFTAKCYDNKTVAGWKTSGEQNSNYFSIERSTDGAQWTVIGNLPAAGNSATEKAYSFTDNAPLQNSFYRIVQYDLDGKAHHTSSVRTSCIPTDGFTLWPNPVRNTFLITITAARESQAVIKLFDGKGALVKIQETRLSVGVNQLSIDMSLLANGVYHVVSNWNNGQTQNVTPLLKQ
jgi:hypothetical protein